MAPEPLLFERGCFKNKSENPHFYPTNGHFELVKKMGELVKEAGISIFFNAEVVEVKKVHTGIVAKILIDETNAQLIKSDYIILTAHSHLEEVTLDGGKNIELPYEIRNGVHCSILIEDYINTSFTHIDIAEGIIDRLSINRGLANKPNDLKIKGHAVLCGRLSLESKQKGIPHDESTANSIIDFVNTIFKTSQNLKCKDFKYFYYENYWRTQDQILEIQKNMPQNVIFLNSTDILNSFNSNIDRWKKYLRPVTS